MCERMEVKWHESCVIMTVRSDRRCENETRSGVDGVFMDVAHERHFEVKLEK
jgi:hypothetical protein